MLLDDDVVSDGEAEASSLSGRLCREEGIEHLFPYLGWNAGAVVTHSDLNFIAKVLCRRHQGWLTAFAVVLLFALGRRIEAIGDQFQESPCDLLRAHIDLTGGWIKGPLHIDLEALLFRASTMIGEIEALLDEGVGINQPMFPRSFA